MESNMESKCKKKHDIRVSKKGSSNRKRTHFPKGVKHKHLEKRASSPIPSTSTHDIDECIGPAPPRKIFRYDKQFFADLVVETPANELSTPGADGNNGDAMLLRPLSTGEEDNSEDEPVNIRKTGTGEYNADTGNLILEKSRLMNAINSFILKHESVECKDD